MKRRPGIAVGESAASDRKRNEMSENKLAQMASYLQPREVKTVRLSSLDLGALQELVELTEAKTHSEVVRDAIRLYYFIVHMYREGFTVEFVKRDEDDGEADADMLLNMLLGIKPTRTFGYLGGPGLLTSQTDEHVRAAVKSLLGLVQKAKRKTLKEAN